MSHALGKSHPKNSWQYVTISILDVLNSFIKNLFNVKSNGCIVLLFKLQTFNAYNRIGKHLHFKRSTTTSSEASLPTFAKILFAARRKDFLAWSIEQFKFHKTYDYYTCVEFLNKLINFINLSFTSNDLMCRWRAVPRRQLSLLLIPSGNNLLPKNRLHP